MSGTNPTGVFNGYPTGPLPVPAATVLLAAASAQPGAPMYNYTYSQIQGGGQVINVVTDFGADPTGATDSSAAINAAFDAVRARKPTTPAPPGTTPFGQGITVVFPYGGTYLVTSSINMTKLRFTVIEGGGSTIYGKISGSVPIIDASSSANIRINNLFLFGDQVAQAQVGIMIGRNTTLVDAGAVQFSNVQINGWFSLAALYSRQSEVSQFYSCTFINSQSGGINIGGFAYVGDGTNRWNVQSAFVATTLPVNIPASFNDNSFYGCTFISFGLTGAALWLSECRHHRWYCSYIYSTYNAVILWFNFVVQELISNTMLTFDCHVEGGPGYVFWYTGTVATILMGGIEYYDHSCNASIAVFGADPSMTLVEVRALKATAFFNSANLVWFATPSVWVVDGVIEGLNSSTWTPLGYFSGTFINPGANPLQTTGYSRSLQWGLMTADAVTVGGALSIQGDINVSSGRVASINVGSGGGWNYPTYPSGTFSAPGGGGTTATFTVIAAVWNGFQGPTDVVTPGTGYAINDVLTFTGGTLSAGGLAATAIVTQLTAGNGIAAFASGHGGPYSAYPPSPNSVTGGSGTGAQLALTAWSVASGTTSTTITNAGSQYLQPPTTTWIGDFHDPITTINMGALLSSDVINLSVTVGASLISGVGTPGAVTVSTLMARANPAQLLPAISTGQTITLSASAGPPVLVPGPVIVQTSSATIAAGTIILPQETLLPDGYVQDVFATGTVTALTLVSPGTVAIHGGATSLTPNGHVSLTFHNAGTMTPGWFA